MMVEAELDTTFETRISGCEDDLAFVRFFRKEGVCWRCVCLLFNERDLDVYRSHARIAQLDSKLLGREAALENESPCRICMDVVAKAELAVS